MRGSLAVWICLGLLCAVLPGGAAAQEAVPRLECPEGVAEGEPFFATVYSPRPMLSVRAHWLGKEVVLTQYHHRGGYSATALLGLSLRERLKGSRFELRVVVRSASVHGVEETTFSHGIRRIGKSFPEERLTVSSRFSALSKSDQERIRREGRAVTAAKNVVNEQRFWQCPFVRPVPGRITSVFGLRRFFNDRPRSPHNGVDFDAQEGEPVRAFSRGRVILADEHFYSGKAVYLDHGQGVVSMYFHLSRLLVDPGSMVEAGGVIGHAGATGRVTGPHVHFGLSVLGQLVDPMLLFLGACPEDP